MKNYTFNALNRKKTTLRAECRWNAIAFEVIMIVKYSERAEDAHGTAGACLSDNFVSGEVIRVGGSALDRFSRHLHVTIIIGCTELITLQMPGKHVVPYSASGRHKIDNILD